MAEREDIGVPLEQLRGGDGSVREAMELWSSLFGPAIYNKWQSTYFHLLREGFQDIHAPQGESSQERQVRMKATYEDVHLSIHGPGHIALAVRAAHARDAARVQERRLVHEARLQMEQDPAPPLQQPEYTVPNALVAMGEGNTARAALAEPHDWGGSAAPFVQQGVGVAAAQA